MRLPFELSDGCYSERATTANHVNRGTPDPSSLDTRGWKHVHGPIRTTLNLPESLLKRAKIEAVQRGTTLRELVRTALERELAAPARGKLVRRRGRFPIFGSYAPGSLRLTNAKIAKLESDEDVRRYWRAR